MGGAAQTCYVMASSGFVIGQSGNGYISVSSTVSGSSLYFSQWEILYTLLHYIYLTAVRCQSESHSNHVVIP